MTAVLRPSPLSTSTKLSPLSRTEVTAAAKEDAVHPTHAAVLWGNLLADHLAQQEIAEAFKPVLSAAAPVFVPKVASTPMAASRRGRGNKKPTASLNASAPAFAPGSSAIKKPKAWTPKATTKAAAPAPAEDAENVSTRAPTANAASGVRLTGHLTGIKLVRSKSDRSRLLHLAQDIVGGLPLKRSAASDLALSLDSLGFSA